MDLADQLAQLARAAHSTGDARPLVLRLWESGDLSPALRDSVYLEPGSLEHECADLFGDCGIVVRVYFDGTIEHF